MKSVVTYGEFRKDIDSIKLVLSEEQHVNFTPTSRMTTKGDETVIEELIEVVISDASVSYNEVFSANRNQLTELINVLQELKSQIK